VIDHWYSVPALLALVLDVGAIRALGPTYSIVFNQLKLVSCTPFHSHFFSPSRLISSPPLVSFLLPLSSHFFSPSRLISSPPLVSIPHPSPSQPPSYTSHSLIHFLLILLLLFILILLFLLLLLTHCPLSGPLQTTHFPPRVASRPHFPQGLSVCLSVGLSI
jgi:hypothetical protein